MNEFKRIDAVKMYEYLQCTVSEEDLPAYTPATITGILYALNSRKFGGFILHCHPALIKAMGWYLNFPEYALCHQALTRQSMACIPLMHEQPTKHDSNIFLPF